MPEFSSICISIVDIAEQRYLEGDVPTKYEAPIDEAYESALCLNYDQALDDCNDIFKTKHEVSEIMN